MNRPEQIYRIDSHQHFWKLERGDYGWLTAESSVLYRDFLPADLAVELKQSGIRQTVLVQAADTEAETDFLLSLAEKTDFIAGVVGWVDMEDCDAPEKIQRLAGNSYCKGIRPMIQDISDPDWMLKPELTPAFDALTACDLSFDALILPKHLHNLLTLLTRHPRLRVVIDHAAKPKIAGNEWEPWRGRIATLAAETSVYCKLSGLVTEAAFPPNAQQLQPYVDCLLDYFGPGRLMWGSDWPVVTMAMSYQGWDKLTRVLLQHVPQHDINQVFGGTAREFYRIL